jgi:carbonic anhydrase/acetyltransferase-like protein (isoleucine patch superfamily)
VAVRSNNDGIRKTAFALLATFYTVLIYVGPAAALAAIAVTSGSGRFAVLAGAPLLYPFGFVVVAGTLARIHAGKLVTGRFARSTSVPAYFDRRLYGLCWTAVFYFTPIYSLVLGLPVAKALLFRLFGYTSSLEFTTYPDTWIRDLPLLDLRPGAYISNRATLGTNMVMSDGTILVDRIVVGERTLVGHLAKIAPGVELGANVQIGVGVGIGIRTHIGDNVQIGPMAFVEHFVRIEAGARVGGSSYVGSRSRIAAGVVIPGGSVIPQGTHLRSQADLKQLRAHIVQRDSQLELHVG